MTRNMRIWSDSISQRTPNTVFPHYGRNGFQSGTDALPVLQLARKADTKAVWICDYEISETVIPVVN
jgi:hypothetical protein